MDKKVIEEMVSEYETMLSVITKRLNYLRSLLGSEKTCDFNTEIEQRRREIQEEIEKTKQQAIAHASSLRSKMMDMPKHFGPQGDDFHEKK